jgi:deleted-in-malignant-brain-tumors protein 1
VTNNLFGRGTSPIVARYVHCTGAEVQFSSCYYSTVSLSSGGSYQAPSYYDISVGVICQGINTSRPTECNHGDVQLVNGSRDTEGRVEVCAYGYWAIACNDYWSTTATHLVCKQQGLPTESMHACRVYFNFKSVN